MSKLNDSLWPPGFIQGHLLGIRAGASHCGQCPDKAEAKERRRMAEIERNGPDDEQAKSR